MKRTLTSLAPLLAVCFLASCASISPGHDPVVVNAERTTTLALDVFDTFLLWEYDNREVLSVIPDIRKSADRVRAGAPQWLVSARRATKAYKDNRTPENKAALETWVAVLRAAITEANSYLPLSLKK